MKNFLILILIISFFSCAPSSSDKTIRNTKNYTEAFRIYFKNNCANFKNSTEIEKVKLNNNLLNQFYKATKYSAIWLNDSLLLNSL